MVHRAPRQGMCRRHVHSRVLATKLNVGHAPNGSHLHKCPLLFQSGLTQMVRDSPHSLAEVAADLMSFIHTHIPTPRQGILAGNSVHADKVFLAKYMPEVVEHLHYRIIDVSTGMGEGG